MKKIFITGGSGYVGRNIIREAIESGYSVVALARSKASVDMVEELGAIAVNGDVLDSVALKQGMTGCDWLIHAAADVNHGSASKEQEIVNVEGTRTVLRSAREAGISRAIHISTEAVLASGDPMIEVDETHPIPETHAGAYSKTKALAETTALNEKRDNFDVLVARPRMVWGRDDTTLLPQLIDAAQSGKLKWIDGGSYLTSTTHIANLTFGVFQVLKEGKSGEVYFLTDGEYVEFKWFVSQLLSTQKVDVPRGSVPRWLVKISVIFGEAFEKITFGVIKPPMSSQEYGNLAHEVTVVMTQ